MSRIVLALVVLVAVIAAAVADPPSGCNRPSQCAPPAERTAASARKEAKTVGVIDFDELAVSTYAWLYALEGVPQGQPIPYEGYEWDDWSVFNQATMGYPSHSYSNIMCNEASNGGAADLYIRASNPFTLGAWFVGFTGNIVLDIVGYDAQNNEVGRLVTNPLTYQGAYSYYETPFAAVKFVIEAHGTYFFMDDVLGGAAPNPPVISTIPSFDDGVCSPAVTVTGPADGTALTFSTFDTQICDVFSDAGCSAQITTATVSGGSAVFYLKCSFSYYQKLSVNGVYSNVFQVVGHSSALSTPGSVCGDPHFIGYDGREFLFDGIIGDYYNLYSDPHLNINSMFKDAKTANPYVKSSVNGAMALRTFNFNITLNPSDYDAEKKAIMYEFNGKQMWITEDQRVTMDSGCVVISFEKDVNTRHHHHTFEVMAYKFRVFAYVSKDTNSYINTEYLDYFIGVDKTHPAEIGGIIGETAGTYNPEDIIDNPDRYHMSSALEAGAKFGDKNVCKAAAHNVISKRAMDQPNCITLPNGYRCYKHRTCSSGYCGRTKVCQPWNGCLATADCESGQTCTDGYCA